MEIQNSGYQISMELFKESYTLRRKSVMRIRVSIPMRNFLGG